MLIRKKFATGVRSMASHMKVICGSNTKDLRKSKQKGRNRRKRIRKKRIRREKKNPTKI